MNNSALVKNIVRIISICILVLTGIITLMPVFQEYANERLCPFWVSLLSGRSIYFGIFYVLSSAIILIYIYSFIAKRSNGSNLNLWMAFTSIFGLWIYYRFFYNGWTYFDTGVLGIKYIDCIGFGYGVLALTITLFTLRNYFFDKKRLLENSPRLNLDHPISNRAEDKLNREPFVKNIAKNLEALDISKNGGSVAIVGQWGSGKTSFLRMLSEILYLKKGITVIHFSPWELGPSANITKSFYSQLASSSRLISSKVPGQLRKYSKAIDGFSGFKGFSISQLFEQEHDIERLNDIVTESFKNSTQRVFIIIDDLDRLSATELIEVFRIIRGSACLPNILFISAFDKEYVTKVLSDYSSAMAADFSDKFFQLEYSLPSYDKSVYRQIILDRASSFMSPSDLEDFAKYIGEPDRLFQFKSPYELFTNPRSINRWMNNMQVSYNLLNGNCLISDLADLEILKLEFPEMYKNLRDHTSAYLHFENGHARLWTSNDTVDDHRKWLYGDKYDLLDCDGYKNLDKFRRKLFDELINRLLPKYLTQKGAKAFCNPPFMKRYFYGVLQSSEISTVEFSDLIIKPLSEIKEIVKLYGETKAQSLIIAIYQFPTASQEDLLNRLHLVFYLPSIFDGCGSNPYQILSLVEKLEYSQDEKKSLLETLIYENGHSFFITALFFHRHRNWSEWDPYFTVEECDTICVKMLELAIENNDPFDTVSHFFLYTYEIEETINPETQKKVERKIYNDRALEMFKLYIAKNLLQVIDEFIWTDHQNSNQSKLYYPSEYFELFGGSWDDFEAFCASKSIEILTMNEDARVEEFKQFLAEVEQNKQSNLNTKRAIEFNFVHLKV